MKALEQLRTYAFGNKRVIPSLDGIRAVSVLFVVAAHLCGTPGFPLQLPSRFAEMGIFGVRIFFVISGYLITRILHSELQKTGSISLRRFYFRRALRLFPAAYVYILVVALLARLGYLSLAPHDLLCAFTYTGNFYYARSPQLGHLWSLAVEEQFYLIWPVVFLLVRKDRGVRVLAACLVICPFLKLLSVRFQPWFEFILYADTLATGCLLALLQPQLEASGRYMRRTGAWYVCSAALVALACNYTPSTKLHWLIGDPLSNLCIAFVIHNLVRNPATSVGRFLNLTPVAVAGVMSYSLYLWQQLFSHYGIQNRVSSFPVCLVFSLSAAMASYLLVEGPCLRLRERLERTGSMFRRHPEAASKFV